MRLLASEGVARESQARGRLRTGHISLSTPPLQVMRGGDVKDGCALDREDETPSRPRARQLDAPEEGAAEVVPTPAISRADHSLSCGLKRPRGTVAPPRATRKARCLCY